MKSRESGFTLLEVLVAVTLMSILMTGLFAMFQGMLKLYGQVESTRHGAMQTRLLVNLLHDDLASMLVSGGFSGMSESANDSESRLFSFISGVSVEQTAIGPQESLRAVSYKLIYEDDQEEAQDNDQNKQYASLCRTERPLPFARTSYKDTPLVLTRQVKQCQVRYEDAAGFEKETWNMPAGTSNKALLPRAVIVRLTLVADGEDVEHVLRVPLPL